MVYNMLVVLLLFYLLYLDLYFGVLWLQKYVFFFLDSFCFGTTSNCNYYFPCISFINSSWLGRAFRSRSGMSVAVLYVATPIGLS